MITKEEIQRRIDFIDAFIRIFGEYLSNETLHRLGICKKTYQDCMAAAEEEAAKKPRVKIVRKKGENETKTQATKVVEIQNNSD